MMISASSSSLLKRAAAPAPAATPPTMRIFITDLRVFFNLIVAGIVLCNNTFAQKKDTLLQVSVEDAANGDGRVKT